MRQPSSPDHVERIATQVVDAAIHVHRQLGPGLLESVYQRCLFHTLTKRGLRVRCEVYLPIRFEELLIENALRIDMLVEDCVLIENKSVAKLDDVHTAQLLTYLRLSGNTLGFLLNWNVPMMKDGLKRVVVNHREPPGGAGTMSFSHSSSFLLFSPFAPLRVLCDFAVILSLSTEPIL